MMSFEIFSNKLGKHTVLLDAVEYERLKNWKFYLWSTSRHTGIYVNCYSPENKHIPQRLHRVIMNAKPGEIVDHINRDPLDNRKQNLRITTYSVNNQNAKKRRDGTTSKFKGVHKIGNKWKAQIQISKRKINLGTFGNETDAAKAYNEALDRHEICGPRNNIIKSSI